MHILSFLRLFATASVVLLLHTHQVYAPLLLPRQAPSASTGAVPADDITKTCGNIEDKSNVFMRTVWGQEYVNMCGVGPFNSLGCYTTSSGANIVTVDAYTPGTTLGTYMEWTLNWNSTLNAWSIAMVLPSPLGTLFLQKSNNSIALETKINKNFPFTGMLAQLTMVPPTQTPSDPSFYWNIHVKGDPGQVAIESLNGGWLGKICRFGNLYPATCQLGTQPTNQNMFVAYDTFGWTRNLLEIGIFQNGATDPQQLTACQPTPDWTS